MLPLNKLSLEEINSPELRQKALDAAKAKEAEVRVAEAKATLHKREADKKALEEQRPRARWDATKEAWSVILEPKLSDTHFVVVASYVSKEKPSDIRKAQDCEALEIAKKHQRHGASSIQLYLCGEKGGSGAEVARLQAGRSIAIEKLLLMGIDPATVFPDYVRK